MSPVVPTRRLGAFLLAALLGLGVAPGTPAAADDPPPSNGGGLPDPQPVPAPQPEAQPKARAGAIERLQQRLTALARRVARLAEEARTDPRFRQVEIYKAYESDDFKSRDREIKAKTLIEWVFDTEAPFPLRDSAAKALIAQRWRDPDLSDFRKSGKSPRGRLCLSEVVPALDDDDRNSRGLAHEILKEFWGDTPEAAIAAYKPQKKFKATWKPAVTAWKRYLRKK